MTIRAENTDWMNRLNRASRRRPRRTANGSNCARRLELSFAKRASRKGAKTQRKSVSGDSIVLGVRWTNLGDMEFFAPLRLCVRILCPEFDWVPAEGSR